VFERCFQDSRLATGRQAYHDNGDASRVEEATGHGAVELGRGHVLVLRHIVDAIDEGGAFAPIPGRIGGDFRSAVGRVSVQVAGNLGPGLQGWCRHVCRCPAGQGGEVMWMGWGKVEVYEAQGLGVSSRNETLDASFDVFVRRIRRKRFAGRCRI
jgi:hypothetical protein